MLIAIFIHNKQKAAIRISDAALKAVFMRIPIHNLPPVWRTVFLYKKNPRIDPGVSESKLIKLECKSFLGAAADAKSALNALFVVDSPGLRCSVNCDSALRALLCAQSAEYAVIRIALDFLLCFCERKCFFRTLGRAESALDALGFINRPALVRTIHSNRLFRALLCAQTTVYAAVRAG